MRDGPLALVLLAATATSALGAERAPPRDVDELQARAAEILARNGVPSVGLALLTCDRVLWSAGSGSPIAPPARPSAPTHIPHRLDHQELHRAGAA